MSAHIPSTLLQTALTMATVTTFHSARPLAVSAQARATLSASATVVRADAAWTGHELTQAVLQEAAGFKSTGSGASYPVGLAEQKPLSEGSIARTERNGTMVWARPSGSHDRTTLVTVAHLGS